MSHESIMAPLTSWTVIAFALMVLLGLSLLTINRVLLREEALRLRLTQAIPQGASRLLHLLGHTARKIPPIPSPKLATPIQKIMTSTTCDPDRLSNLLLPL